MSDAEKLEQIRELVAPKWRSIDYDRNALIDDIRAVLDAENITSPLGRVRELVAAADALSPDDFKTGQNHLPPAFREINYRDAFMALAHIMEQIEEAVKR
jgi:hypothetical protein